MVGRILEVVTSRTYLVCSRPDAAGIKGVLDQYSNQVCFLKLNNYRVRSCRIPAIWSQKLSMKFF